jgi:signal peptidase I
MAEIQFQKVRKPWLAALLSFIAPGLGQLYCGSWKSGAIALIIGSLFTGLSSVFLFDTFGKLMTAVSLSLVLSLGYCIEAYRRAKKNPVQVLAPFQRWWIYPIYAFLLHGVPFGYGTIVPDRFLSFQIPSESMVPTLLIGDRLVADGWAFWGKEPLRGDVLVFDYPRDRETKFVKRLVGLPGDMVELRGGELYLNGALVSQERTERPLFRYRDSEVMELREQLDNRLHIIYRSRPSASIDGGPWKVPEGSLFVMGDNRDRSNDSREWGFVPRDHLVGRMSYIYFSWDGEAKRIRWERFGQKIE